jgi:hypothetical protein
MDVGVRIVGDSSVRDIKGEDKIPLSCYIYHKSSTVVAVVGRFLFVVIIKQAR